MKLYDLVFIIKQFGRQKVDPNVIIIHIQLMFMEPSEFIKQLLKKLKL